MRRLLFTSLLPLLVVACASQPPKKLTGRYAIDADLALRSGRAAYDLAAIHDPLVAALSRRVHLTDNVEEPTP